MGGPALARPSQGDGELTMLQFAQKSQRADNLAILTGSGSVGVNSSSLNYARGDRGQERKVGLPTIRNDASQEEDFLAQGSLQEIMMEGGTSREVMGPPLMAASKRPALAGSLSSRKPNLHLSLGESSLPMSRFSAFSSNEGTPSGESLLKGKSNTLESPFSRAGSSPSVSTHAHSNVGTSAIDTTSMAGLGIGMPTQSVPSPRAISEFGALSATSSSKGYSTILPPPQTPERYYNSNLEESTSSSLQTPARSPSNAYDRAGQIGIGELSTPRWTSNVTHQGWPTQTDQIQSIPSRRLADSTPTIQRHPGDGGEARHARAISFSVTAPIQSRASASRASPSAATALSPPRDQSYYMVPSPSMPTYGPSLGGVSSLASLAHQFGDNQERERAMKASRREIDGDFIARGEVDTPDYSINAMSESEDDLVSDLIAHPMNKSVRSPRIGDSAWSEEETGPFAVSTLSQKMSTAVEDKVNKEELTKDLHKGSDEVWRSSFDLEAAIADLNITEDARKRARKAAGVDGDELSARSSGEDTISRTVHKFAQEPLQSQTNSARKSLGSERERANDSAGAPRRSSRRTSSPSMAKTTSMARLPSSSSAQSLNSAKKRSSSASIGHSLLRGSLPFGVSEEYEGILTSGDDAAEALRKLDGVGSTRRSSMVRDQEQSKSPRSSKQLSRPNSAGRRTPGTTNASRTSSPTNKHRDSTHSARQQREESSGSKLPASRRTSRSLGKVKNSEDSSASPLTAPQDSPKRLSYSSPRMRRTQLPPLPLQAIPSLSSPSMTTANLSASTNSTKDASSRVSAASISSSGASTNRPLATNTAKSNRTSETSLSDLPSSVSTGLDLASIDDKGAGLITSPSSVGLVVPPVPPLPKAWEGSRTKSFHSLDTASRQHSSGNSQITFMNSFNTNQRPSTESIPSLNSSILTKKWSFTNLGGALATKKSEEKLAIKRNMAAITSPISANLMQDNDKTVTSKAQHTPTTNDDTSQYTIDSPISHVEKPKAAPSDGAVAPTPVTASMEMSQSPSVSTFRNRRTPSFFRKRSSDALLAENSPSNLMNNGPSNERQGTNSSLTSQDSNEKPRTETTTPSGGRSSRKSILGIGNMLRSASKRNIDTMPTFIPVTAKTAKGSINEVDEETFGSLDSPSRGISTPRIPSLKNIRRSSLMGRKRGKVGTEQESSEVQSDAKYLLQTLPSSTEVPPQGTAITLPPVQTSGSHDSSSTFSRIPRESVMSTTTANRSMETPNKGQLNSSDSQGQIQSPFIQENPNDEIMQAPTLPTIDASPLKTSSDHMDRVSSTEGNQSIKRGLTSEFGQPASRIPRATTFGSLKRSNFSSSSTQSAAPLKRLVGNSGSSLPTSKTSISLASNFGIASDGEQNSMETTRKSLSIPQGSMTSSSSSTLGSSTLVSILNAYTNARSPAEVEMVMRRAKVASHSTTTSSRDKEVLLSLISRQEQKKQTEASVEAAKILADLTATPISKTTRSGESHRINSALSSSSNGHLPSGSSSVPRKVRTSLTAASNSIRSAAREATLTSSTSKINNRISSTPTQARQSPALSEVATTTSATQASSTPSPQPLDEEREGDDEMEAYIRRRHNKKVAQGARLSDLEKMLQFPEDEEPSKCYSQRQAEALWGDKLTDLELEEMRNFKEIYFVGQNVDKRARDRADNASANNSGYDDERGDYLVINHDHLVYRYEVTNLLGRGSFGQVLQCKDHKTGKSVAIKLIRNKKRFHHQALVEVKILENLVNWDPKDEFNVIKILDSFYFRNHLCISMELLSINLYELIKANSFVGFSTKLIRRFTSQVLASLSLLRKNRVIHCDLKPENILLMHPRKSAIRVIDFGSSCLEHEKVYTYIQSRFYRSPEVILGMNYHMGIDIWSLGCIMAELYSGYPLFPGENEQEQLACIMEILGPPDR